MPRSPRLNVPETWHHVMNRGADRQDVFVHDQDFGRFEWLLGDATMASQVEIHAYCLMTNHFHLLLHCPDAGLSEAMQSIQFRYAQWFNRRYARDGPVFRGRFRSVLVESDEQLITVGRYVHRNPLALVRHEALAAYRWSSLGAYLGRRAVPDWLRTEQLMEFAGGDVAQFQRFVEVDLPSDRAAGSPWSILPSCADVEIAVARMLGVPVDALRRTGPRSNVARSLAVSLCMELRVCSTAELAMRFGLSSPSSVRSIARRGRVLVASDPSLASTRRRVLELLNAGRGATLGA